MNMYMYCKYTSKSSVSVSANPTIYSATATALASENITPMAPPTHTHH